MSILVTGPRGFVGARIMEEFSSAVPAPSLQNATEDDIKRLVDEIAPEIIIHTAAVSDIGTCAQNPELSYHANVEIPVWLARTGIKCVMFSSDQIYSGCESNGPYTEDQFAPANLYAEEKYEMEQRTLEINPDTVLLRATWMYDMPLYGVPNRGNFLVNMLRQKEIDFSSTQHRAVTYVREVASQMKNAIHMPGGVYNYGSENAYPMMETAKMLKDMLSLDINIKDAGEQHNLWMDCSKAASCGVHFCSTIDGLKKCIKDYSLI